MDKPITIIVEETKNALVSCVNESNLPPFVLEPILRDILTEVSALKQKQYESDLAKYQEAVAKEEG